MAGKKRSNRSNTERENTEMLGEGIGGVAGAAAGAALGSLAGPVGAVIGAIAGAAGGWWSGKAAADAASSIDTTDDDYYRGQFTSTPRGGDYESAQPAFHLGHVAGMNPEYRGRSFDEIEPHLRRGWTDDVASRSGDWNDVRGYARNAFERGQKRHKLAEEVVVRREAVAADTGTVAADLRRETLDVDEHVDTTRTRTTNRNIDEATDRR